MKPAQKISNHATVAVLLLSLTLSIGPSNLGAFATTKQGGGKFTKQNKNTKTKTKTKTKVKTKAKRTIVGCAKIRVNVDKTAYDGKDWDNWAGDRAFPDLVLKNLGNNTETRQCHDTFSCTYNNISVKGKNIKVKIVDVDTIDADDVIGEGVCSLSKKSCRLGKARLSLSSC